jgi:hypothetical protein
LEIRLYQLQNVTTTTACLTVAILYIRYWPMSVDIGVTDAELITSKYAATRSSFLSLDNARYKYIRFYCRHARSLLVLIGNGEGLM